MKSFYLLKFQKEKIKPDCYMWSSSATAIFHVLKREVQTIVVDHGATPRVLHYSPKKVL